MKGICPIWSRGPTFLFVPARRQVSEAHKSDHQAEFSGNIVWYCAPAQSPEVLLYGFYFVHA